MLTTALVVRVVAPLSVLAFVGFLAAHAVSSRAAASAPHAPPPPPSAAPSASSAPDAGAAPRPLPKALVHTTVRGPDVALVTLRERGAQPRNLTFAELSTTPLPKGKVQVTFTAEGEALYVPHCGGRGKITVAGRDVEAPKDGPFVTKLPPGRSDVVLEVDASAYERRVACGEAPRTGALEESPFGFSTLSFASPSSAKGGGKAVVYVPRSVDLGAKVPVLVGVHPWNGGTWTYAQYTGLLREAEKSGVVLLHPSGLGNSLYVAEAEAEVHRALAALEATVDVDPRRVSIWGASMGGAGATTIGFHSPARFASVTSFFGDSKYDMTTYVRTLLGDDAGAHRVNALDIVENARHLPVWLIHGEADKTSPIAQSEMLHTAMKTRGFDVRFDRVPGAGHEGRLVERFSADVVRIAGKARAPERPTRVTFRSVRPEDTRAYGVTIERAGLSDAYVDLEGVGGVVRVREASGVRAIVLAEGALGVPRGAKVEGTTVPVRWE